MRSLWLSVTNLIHRLNKRHELNVQKTFRKRPGRLLYILQRLTRLVPWRYKMLIRYCKICFSLSFTVIKLTLKMKKHGVLFDRKLNNCIPHPFQDLPKRLHRLQYQKSGLIPKWILGNANTQKTKVKLDFESLTTVRTGFAKYASRK